MQKETASRTGEMELLRWWKNKKLLATSTLTMENDDAEDILDSEHLSTVLTFPSAVQEAIDQVRLWTIWSLCKAFPFQ